MFYLTTHSTHFIYGYMASEIMVKDHSNGERGNPLPPHELLFSISSMVFFTCMHPLDRITHITAFMLNYAEKIKGVYFAFYTHWHHCPFYPIHVDGVANRQAVYLLQ